MLNRRVFLLSAGALAGCGGGGDAAPVPAAAAVPIASTAAPAAPPPQPLRAAVWGDSLALGVVQQLQHDPAATVFDGAVSGNTSTQIRARFMADASHRAMPAVLWAGRNNFAQAATVQADVAAMIDALGHDRFLVLGVINSESVDEGRGGRAYEQILALNADLANRYTSRFVDVRRRLVAAFDPTRPADMADLALDIVPASLRIDQLHLNVGGSSIVAGVVRDYWSGMGW